jgi:hypothetical protein
MRVCSSSAEKGSSIIDFLRGLVEGL